MSFVHEVDILYCHESISYLNPCICCVCSTDPASLVSPSRSLIFRTDRDEPLYVFLSLILLTVMRVRRRAKIVRSVYTHTHTLALLVVGILSLSLSPSPSVSVPVRILFSSLEISKRGGSETIAEICYQIIFTLNKRPRHLNQYVFPTPIPCDRCWIVV